MDMSKLPRLSQTNRADVPNPVGGGTTVPPPAQRTHDVPDYDSRDRGGAVSDYSIGAEVWISVILGLVFIFMGSNFARYAGATLAGKPFHTNVNWMAGEKEGQEVAYFELGGGTAYTDSGLFLFGLALVLEALALLVAQTRIPGKRAFVGFALFVTLAATAYNLFVMVKLFGLGITPLTSLIAVAIGGYMATYQWRLLNRISGETSPRLPTA